MIAGLVVTTHGSEHAANIHDRRTTLNIHDRELSVNLHESKLAVNSRKIEHAANIHDSELAVNTHGTELVHLVAHHFKFCANMWHAHYCFLTLPQPQLSTHLRIACGYPASHTFPRLILDLALGTYAPH